MSTSENEKVEESPETETMKEKENELVEEEHEDDGSLDEEDETWRRPDSKDPAFLDFATWKRYVGGLVRSESHVLLENDEQLREAIEQAMFLEMASENLMKKRQKQLDMLDEFRAKEGETTKKLFSDLRQVLQRNLGPIFERMENDVTLQIAKSKVPITKPLDTSHPPPRPFHDLPPVHTPPPPFAFQRPPPPLPRSVPAFATLPPARRSLEVTFPEFSVKQLLGRSESERPFQATPKIPALMSQHLLPPPRFEKETKKKEEQAAQEVTPLPVRDDSWRKSFHPTPLPPPTQLFDSPVHPIPPFQNGALFGRNATESEARSPFQSRGRVGINVKGIFMGGGGAVKRRNSTSSSSGGEGGGMAKRSVQ